MFGTSFAPISYSSTALKSVIQGCIGALRMKREERITRCQFLTSSTVSGISLQPLQLSLTRR